VLVGSVSPDEAVTHVQGHVLLPNEAARDSDRAPAATPTDRSPWPLAWGWLRRHHCAALQLTLPVPGDPAGLAGPPDTLSSAIAAGSALLCDSTPWALVPSDQELWRARPMETGPPTGVVGTLSESRRAMREAMIEITGAFTSLTPDDAALAEIAQARSMAAPTPPPGVEPRAAQLAASAIQVWEFMEIAARAATRSDRPVPELGDLKLTARRALSVAFSHSLSIVPTRQ
jgi:hypothetical protein